MALKTTQGELKRKFREEIKELKIAIWLMCADCEGFFLNPYQKCLDKNCSLYKFYPTAGKASSPTFKKKIYESAKRRDNHKEVLSQITKLEPKNVREES